MGWLTGFPRFATRLRLTAIEDKASVSKYAKKDPLVGIFSYMGPKPGITRLELDSVISISIERILTAFDDVVQVGLVRLRLREMFQISDLV